MTVGIPSTDTPAPSKNVEPYKRDACILAIIAQPAKKVK